MGNPNPNPKTRFKAGASGNPSGRPKRTYAYKEELIFQLTEQDPNDPRGRTHGRIILDQHIAQAKHGHVRSTEFIFDRLFGKPVQAILTGETGARDIDEEIADILEMARTRAEARRMENGNNGPIQ